MAITSGYRMLDPTRVLRGLPRRVRLLAWRLRWGHKPYANYYRRVLDEAARKDPRWAVGGLWEEMGKLQLDFLKSQGMRPEHTLLDVGCGCLRGGLHFIQYLDPDNYWGLDISSDILAVGQQYLRQEGLEHKRPRLLQTNGRTFEELQGRRFDFIFSFGVFSDVPPEQIRELFKNLHDLLSPSGVFFATFGPADKYIANPVGLRFFYPLSFFAALGEKTGYSVELVEEFLHPRGHAMLALRPLLRVRA